MYSYIYYHFMIQNKLHIIQIDQYFTTPKPTESENHENPDKLTAVNLQILHNLWLPDVEILNLKAFETHRVLSKLEGVWIDNDHRLLYALATRITFICPMKFNAFPMDIQRCLFQVRNFDLYFRNFRHQFFSADYGYMISTSLKRCSRCIYSPV